MDKQETGSGNQQQKTFWPCGQFCKEAIVYVAHATGESEKPQNNLLF